METEIPADVISGLTVLYDVHSIDAASAEYLTPTF
jgi:hypothetical protein